MSAYVRVSLDLEQAPQQEGCVVDRGMDRTPDDVVRERACEGAGRRTVVPEAFSIVWRRLVI